MTSRIAKTHASLVNAKTHMKKAIVALSALIVILIIARNVFIKDNYTLAVFVSLLMFWVLHPKGQKAYLERRSHGIPLGESGFNTFSKVIFAAMLSATLVMIFTDW